MQPNLVNNTGELGGDDAVIVKPVQLVNQVRELVEKGDLRQALAAATQSLERLPNHVELWNLKGVILRGLGHSQGSLECYQRVIELKPESAGAWSNLGNSLKDLGHFETAIFCHERAVYLQPGNAVAFHNLGLTFASAGRDMEAIAAFDRALLSNRTSPDIRWDRGLSLLRTGNLSAGWVDYEARFENGMLSHRGRPGKQWSGQSFRGQTIVITAEQGFGDTIWAMRFLPRVKALGGTVILECKPQLIELVRRLGAVDHFIALGKALPHSEWFSSICSLPGLFTPDLAAIQGKPYIRIESQQSLEIERCLGLAQGRLKVGIVWSGSVTFKGNHERAVSIDRFLKAFSLPGVHLFSLQKGSPSKAIDIYVGERLTDLGPCLDNFIDTAKAILAMDLIVMTDSAVAHLAGALGKPVWLLLGHNAYWLWSTKRKDCPWYASMQIIRQRVAGDWNGVFDQASAALLSQLGLRGLPERF